MHPRNRHLGGLDFKRLIASSPALAPHVTPNQWGNESIEFADPEAVKALNKALLKSYYGVAFWDIPPGYLCPSVPGRADYLHSLADLLAGSNGGVIPRGAAVRALDLGVGANCVYPLIGTAEYGWRFIGSEIDPIAAAAAKQIVAANPGLKGKIEIRLQGAPDKLLEGVLKPGESLEVVLCNPPFHRSAEEAAEGSARKWRNLGKQGATGARPPLNFGGRGHELWCPGGESAFVRRLVEESGRASERALWFTSLVSRKENLPGIERALKKAAAREVRVVELTQGQKQSRMLAWTFLDDGERAAWAARRWRTGRPGKA